MNTAIVRYTLITSIRDSLYIGMFIILSAAIGISKFLGFTALTEENQMKITYAAGSCRLIVCIGLITFVCFHVNRMIYNREIEFILSKPLSRLSFIISYILALVLISLSIILFVSLILSTFTDIVYNGLFYWSISLLFEAIILIAFAVLASIITESAVISILSTFAFYILARMIGFFIIIDEQSLLYSNPILSKPAYYFMHTIISALPRLDLFAKTSWLIHEKNNIKEMLWHIIQSVAYIPLLISIAAYDINKKHF